LFSTNRPKQEIVDYFKNFNFVDYAKAGFVPSEDIVYETGPLPTSFPTSMIEQLRKLGMEVEVDNGKLVLKDDFTAATKGQPLTPEQCKAHVHFETKLSPFILTLDCFWSDGKFSTL
jgi:mRNA turnover protein 4